MNFILNRKIKYYTKEVFRLINLVAIALFIILFITLIKYNVVCEVTIAGQKVGYIADKEHFEQSVQDYINEEQPNKEYTVIEYMPEYKLKLVDKKEKTNEDIIMATLKETAETTYKLYAVTVDGKENAILSNLGEAESLVKELSNQYEKKLGVKIAIIEKTTTSNTEGVKTATTAKTEISKTLTAQVKKKEEAEAKAKAKAKAQAAAIKAASKATSSKGTTTKKVSLNGVTLSVTPVSGIITSRYGNRESIRNHSHSGLDIAAPTGTKIKAAAAGTVTFSGYSGGYGYVVKISHGSGVQTFYAHCSKLYVSKGDTVTAGQVIAAVGSTGNSTGPHLHFEVRKNGYTVNPQHYLY